MFGEKFNEIAAFYANADKNSCNDALKMFICYDDPDDKIKSG